MPQWTISVQLTLSESKEKIHIADDMKKQAKLVIDTNILVAATRNRHGPSFALMQTIRLKQVTMCCSPALFLEYEDVLKRPDQLAASRLLGSDIDAILKELAGCHRPAYRIHSMIGV